MANHCVPLFAAGGVAAISRISVGTQGIYKVGMWTPVTVEVETCCPRKLTLVLETIDSDGNPNQITFPPKSFGTAGVHQLKGHYLPGRLEAGLTVRVLTANGEVLLEKRVEASEAKDAELPVAQKRSLFLIGLVTKEGEAEESSDVWFDSFSEAMAQQESVELLTFNRFADLPRKTRTLEMFDALVLSDQVDLSQVQSERLENWVKKGGRLVVLLGGQEEKYPESPLSSWLPVSVDGSITLREMGALENYVGKGNIPRGTFKTAKMTPTNELVQIEISNLQRPICLSASYGFGQLKTMSVDLTDPLFTEWEGLAPLLSKLIGVDRILAGEVQADLRGNLAKGGVSDTRTQMQTTLERFDSESTLSIWGIMARIMILVVLIGPLDYLLVHQLLKRPEFTWFTFPVILALSVYWAVNATAGTQMSETALREVNLFELDESTGFSRTRSWQSFKVPESAQYDVKLTPDLEQFKQPTRSVETVESPLLTWSGTPEDSFLGMYRSGGLMVQSPTYSFSETGEALEGVPVARLSSKVVETDWTTKTSGLIESDLHVGVGGRLVGNLTHHLPVAVEDWFVVYDGRVYQQLSSRESDEVISLKPHQRWVSNDPKVQRRILKQFLHDTLDPTQRDDALRTITSDNETQGEYDFKNPDPDYYFKTIAFRDYLGGRAFTRISNDVLKKYDMTEQLSLKKAMLIGKMELPVSRTTVNGKTIEPEYSATVVRFLLPVRKTP